jgi:hypothetical protein
MTAGRELREVFAQLLPICRSSLGAPDLARRVEAVLGFAVRQAVFVSTVSFSGDQMSTYQLFMAVFGKQMEADTILDTASTTTSLLSVGTGDE